MLPAAALLGCGSHVTPTTSCPLPHDCCQAAVTCHPPPPEPEGPSPPGLREAPSLPSGCVVSFAEGEPGRPREVAQRVTRQPKLPLRSSFRTQVGRWAIPPLVWAPRPRPAPRPTAGPPCPRRPCPLHPSLAPSVAGRPSGRARRRGSPLPPSAALTWAPAPRPAGSRDPRSSSAPPAQQLPGSRSSGMPVPNGRRADFGDEAGAALRGASVPRGFAGSSGADLPRSPSPSLLGLGGTPGLDPGTRLRPQAIWAP